MQAATDTTPRAAAIDIRRSTVAEMRENAARLFQQHYEEIAVYPDLMKLEPWWENYEALEAAGLLLALAAWIGDELVGYSATIICPHLHYRSLTWAQNDVLFVAEEHRNGSVGSRIMRETEAQASALGANVMAWNAKAGTALDRALSKPGRGYRVQDIVYTREI